MMTNEPGIYKFTNKVNGKVYIGQTKYLYTRYREHKSELLNNKHHNTYLQRAVNKYGFNNFEHEVLKLCSKDELDFWEEYYIDLYNALDRSKGYNILPAGNVSDMPEETKNKIRVANQGINAKLKESEVAKIKEMLCDGYQGKELALMFGVKISTISKINRVINWKQVRPDLNKQLLNMYKAKQDFFKSRKEKKILTDESRKSIENAVKNDFMMGLPVTEVMEKNNITYTQYKRITKGLYPVRDKVRFNKIIHLQSSGMLIKDIAKVMGLERGTIRDIINRNASQANTVLTD